ncbi:hypothetical protein PNOK_0972000 [Pyrrhoderma noxium]|uniref:Uncharacterized protein n=1 Tax=Pyrrhoderma noxium TaxID=2282107 RepID=A0A286U529_9AGAM|nr:hypothetical protein PNOK_0972000 [Pyrrhoderma noxium]
MGSDNIVWRRIGVCTDSTRSATDVNDHVGTVTSPMLSSARRAGISKDHRFQVSTRYTKATSATASALSVHERNIDIVHHPKLTASSTPTRSHASTIRRNTANAAPSFGAQRTLRPPFVRHYLCQIHLSIPVDNSTSAFRTLRGQYDFPGRNCQFKKYFNSLNNF